MLTPVAPPEQVSRSDPRRGADQPGDGMRRVLAGTPVQMLLMLQRTVGNQAVNQLLRQYKSSRYANPGLFPPTVQRCGGTACNCSPQEKAAHASARPLEEEQTPTTSGTGLATLQRDADEDDGSGGAAVAAQDSGGASASESNGGSGQSAAAEEPSAAPDDQDSAQTATAAANPDDSRSIQSADHTDTAAAQPGADGGGQSAAVTNQGDGGQAADPSGSGDSAADAGPVEPVATIDGEGEPHDEVVFGGDSLQLQGRTNAHYRNRFSTPNMTTTAATGCSCADANCVHVTGVMTSTFTVTTDVSLPSVPSGLSDCQQKTVRAAISSCLSPHEQRHVAAFNAYNGTVRTPFDSTCCRSDVQSTLRDMHDAIEGPRHDAVQASSDALDPFQVDIDLDCQPGDDPNAGVHCPPSS